MASVCPYPLRHFMGVPIGDLDESGETEELSAFCYTIIRPIPFPDEWTTIEADVTCPRCRSRLVYAA